MNETTDLFRLVAIPVFAWAAWSDIKTRRVTNLVWPPLLALAGVLLLWEGWNSYATPEWTGFALGVGLSIGLLVPIAYLLWHFGLFGGADAKAIMALSVLFPVTSFTIVTNSILVSGLYPLAYLVRDGPTKATVRKMLDEEYASVPFMVPIFLGLVLALTYGDLLIGITEVLRRP